MKTLKVDVRYLLISDRWHFISDCKSYRTDTNFAFMSCTLQIKRRYTFDRLLHKDMLTVECVGRSQTRTSFTVLAVQWERCLLYSVVSFFLVLIGNYGFHTLVMSRKFGVVLYFVYICSIQSTKGIYERYFSVGKLVQFDFDEDDTFTRCMLLEHRWVSFHIIRTLSKIYFSEHRNTFKHEHLKP